VKIEVLGTGCPKCQSLAKNVEAAVRELGLAATVEKVMDIEAIAERGVMVTPALAIDGEIKSVGRALMVGQVRVLLGGTR
jgi:small redox-active disulfide protein 2